MDNLCHFVFKSPIGKIQISGNEKYITEIKMVGKGDVRKREKIFPHIQECHKQLMEYFKGSRKKFDLPLQLNGTQFQKSVWKNLKKIPYGKLNTYGEIAKSLGNTNKARAVGGACNKNNLLVVVPCHRVVGTAGLTGFACGLEAKNWLLNLESSI